MKIYNNILFDFDGTLFDTSEGVFTGLEYALSKIGFNDYDKSIFKTFIGPPLPQSLKNNFNFDDEKINTAIDIFKEKYSKICAYQSKLYDGMTDTLNKLKSAGKKIYIATSKPTIQANYILEQNHIKDYFIKVYGADSREKNSDKDKIIKWALSDIENATSDNTIMIGDTKYDIIGAKKNNLDTIGVLYGFGTLEDFKKYGADYIAEKPADILKILL